MSQVILAEPIELSYLSPGDQVFVSRRGRVCFSGTVEELSSKLEVVWIRESEMGERKLFCPPEYVFHRTDNSPRRQPGPAPQI
ncbi:hypothetical protein FB478_11436 [Arthrobacter sp. AG367]|uniref:hypothetical protein n=1 Tax=Arthrobacter sp. AG367 TaxID=2572909 RepID=UPI0011A3A51F|nr:hypothetical protein [Arthrobacter sp. AG367]TWD47080.1 hypothetical protein FB478_11436 [Arthrobacter sp. AG367]